MTTNTTRFLVRTAAAACAALAFTLAAPGPASAQRISIKLATIAPEGTSWHSLIAEMGERWTEATDGKVRLKIFAGGVMGGEGDVLRRMRIGNLQAATLTASGLRDISNREVQTLQVPGLVRTDAELDHVWETMGPRFEKTLYENGYQVLHWGEAGWGHFFTKEPLASPADTAGFKIFSVSGDPGVADTFKSLGFTPIVIASTEMIPSLKTGMINATLAPPYAALSLRWFEEAPNMTDVRMMPLVGGTILSRKVWDKIPPDVQATMLEISRDVGKRARADVRQSYQESIDAMKAKGLNIVEPTAEQRAAWDDAQQTVWKTVKANGVVPADVFDETHATLEKFRAQ